MPEIMETTFRSRFCLHFFIYRFELDGRLKHRMGIFFGRSTKNFTEKICNQKKIIDIVSEGQINALPWIAEGYFTILPSHAPPIWIATFVLKHCLWFNLICRLRESDITNYEILNVLLLLKQLCNNSMQAGSKHLIQSAKLGKKTQR